MPFTQLFCRLTLSISALSFIVGCGGSSAPVLESPDGSIKLSVQKNKTGGISYFVSWKDSLVIEPSQLGLILENENYFDSMKIKSISAPVLIEDEYTMMHGKRKHARYKANQQTIYCENATGKKLNIVFNVSNEGIAFRYHFPDTINEVKRIVTEKTTFHLPTSAKAWLQPMSVAKSGWNKSNPSYEEYYQMEVSVGTPSPLGAGWVFPALFQSHGAWVLITESGLGRTYCGSKLENGINAGQYKIGFPDAQEGIFQGPVLPESTLPWASPWRVIAIGDLKNIVESTLGTDVADPAIDIDTTFIKPGLASWSWALLKDESVTYKVQKQFIDYASQMHWPYCLVDVNWDTNIGYERMTELSAYAKSKQVGLIVWYNSAGDWNTTPYHPRSKLLTHEAREVEFSKLNAMGISGVKVDFFGGDGQSVIAYYHDILIDAAEHKLLVNFHGATLPRGWSRTYPHLMTMESIRGFEFITFEQSNANQAAAHCALIPFTRNAFDPMDFTPMSLDSIPGINRLTHQSFELALPVLFLSGIQHIAETPEGLSKMPDFAIEYLKGLPTDWDDVKFIDGYPGRYIVVARRKGGAWFISGINATQSTLNLDLKLDFIGTETGKLITNGNQNMLELTDISLEKNKPLPVTLTPNGGLVMKF